MASSSSETSNNSTDPSTTIPSLSNLPFIISVKLNSSNYPTSEVKDFLILATINALLTEDVLTQVMSYPISREVWLALERNFSSISHAKAIQIRTQLANARKGALPSNAYFLLIKRMADELALVGQPLNANDIITYVLVGLGQEYDSLASTITSYSDPVTLEELYSLLLIFPESVEPTPKPAPVVLPPNLNLSLSSSSVSAGTNVQFAIPSPLHMASTSSPQIDLHLASGSPTRDTTLP
ncbi:hypothetical protein F0562_002269 [Nyssa sinensis]|uniref:Retrotransposon Copia-like N-terminal domain-containing protein n=1 Tax=Nyssa sinensis TaxID=561372 RepID=A0A5J5C5E4_9ASTE|nr:hypothetical protein F0562_002269 [Nyssa sinensis]